MLSWRNNWDIKQISFVISPPYGHIESWHLLGLGFGWTMTFTSHTHSNRATLYCRYVSFSVWASMSVWVCVSGHIRTGLDLASEFPDTRLGWCQSCQRKKPQTLASRAQASVCQSLPLSPHNWTASFSLSVLKHSRCFLQQLLSDTKTYSLTCIMSKT